MKRHEFELTANVAEGLEQTPGTGSLRDIHREFPNGYIRRIILDLGAVGMDYTISLQKAIGGAEVSVGLFAETAVASRYVTIAEIAIPILEGEYLKVVTTDPGDAPALARAFILVEQG